MPFIPHTPESLLRRSDSRNPATTCKGITTSGTHCRRSISSPSPPTSYFPRRRPKTTREGVLAVCEPGDGVDDEGAAAFFCWQHKDQAVTLTNTDQNGRKTNLVNLQKRTSVDTLVDRLGLLDTGDHGKGKSRRETKKQWTKQRPARKDTLPKQWQRVDGPLLAVPGRQEKKNAKPRKRREPSLFSMLCCIGSSDNDPLPPARVARDGGNSSSMKYANEKAQSQSQPSKHPMRTASPNQRQPATRQALTPQRPGPNRDASSHTQTLLSFIPKTLPPQTTSLLLAELAKPVSPHDEAGYIYIFWLTPSSTLRPDDDTASSLLTSKNDDTTIPNIPCPHAHPAKEPTLLLKIGRASNVQRRMNQWTRQCGYDLSLIRFYPYLPSMTKAPSPLPSPRRGSSLPPPSPSRSAEEQPTKVPHAHKIERLIHLELADKRVKKECEVCGREHREWFEMEGSRGGVGSVDAVVRRWVGWGMGMGK